MLLFARSAFNHNLLVSADADGPVRSSMIWRSADASGCWLLPQCLSEGMVLYHVDGDDGSDPSASKEYGAIGGPMDQLHPGVLAHFAEPESMTGEHWSCSSKWLLRYHWPFTLTAYRWDLSEETLVHSPSTDPEGLHAVVNAMVGDAVFFVTTAPGRDGIDVWTPSGGTRPFIRWIGDPTRGANGIGTDGVDLVWSYGEGKQPADSSYPVRSIMTAPFTTAAEQLEPRRLCSEPRPMLANDTWKVGCGYAASTSDSPQPQLVRLSDGWSWAIPTTADCALTTPIGVTCEEIFLQGHVGQHWTIGRIKIASLGAGQAPD